MVPQKAATVANPEQALSTAREQFTRELEQQRTASAAAEERHAADMKRMLLDVDRERVQSTKFLKVLAPFES